MDKRISELIQARRNDWSRSYRETTAYNLGRFQNWVRREELDWKSLSEDEIEGWMDRFDWSPSYRHGMVCGLKALYAFALGEANSPVAEMTIKRPKPKPQRTLTAAEIETVMAVLDTATPKGARDLSLITLMLDTGLRASEILRLKLEDVSVEHRKLRAIVKGGDWSHRVFGEYAASSMISWMAMRPRFAWIDIPNLYVSVGGPKPGTPMTITGLRATFYRLSEDAGIEKFSPHALRRSFATLSLRNGAPSRLVQIAGGWKDIEMVERYSQQLEADDFRWFPTDHIMGVGSVQD